MAENHSAWRKYIIGELSWKRLIRSVIIIYLIFLCIGLFVPNFFIFPVKPSRYELPRPHHNLIKSSSGDDICIYYRAPASDDQPVILWSHGNAEDLSFMPDLLVDYQLRGFGVASYDYPGYGQSTGSPTEESCFAAIEAAYQFLTKEQNISADRIVIIGRSVGGGPSSWLASQHECRGLILISSFTSAFKVATRWPIFPGDKFRNDVHLKSVSCPLLLIHGTDDKTIASWHSGKLFSQYQHAKSLLLIDGANHDDLFLQAGIQLVNQICAFSENPAEYCAKQKSPSEVAAKVD